MKFWTKNRIIISILVFFIFLFSILLFFDLRRKKDIGDRKVIGIIRYKQKVIQRKFDGDVVWEKIDKDTPVTNRDTIRTTDNSIVDIELNDKTEIKMDENSMIVLDFSNEKIDIDFSYGTISAKTENKLDAESKLNVKSGDKTIELGKSNAVLSKVNEKNLNVSMEKGSALIKTKNGDSKIEKDQLANIGENKVEIKKNPIRLVNPPNQQVLFSNLALMSLNFTWQSEKSSENILEIASDSNFKNKIKTAKKTLENSEVQKLAPAVYYWRVSSKLNSENLVSETSKFTIVKQESLVLNNPSKDSKYFYGNANPMIVFSWSIIENVRSYRLEVSKDSEFKNISYSSDLMSNRIVLDSFGEGKYYTRIITKPSASFLSSQTSEINSFTVERKKSLSPIQITTVSGSTTSLAAISKGNFLLSWKSDPDYKLYEVEISKTKTFDAKKTFQTKMNFFNPSQLEKGQYYFRVKGITAAEQSSEYTTSNFTIKESSTFSILQPLNNSELTLAQNQQIEFNWSKTDLSGTSNLEIALDANFNDIEKRISINGNNTSVAGLKSGNYFARVKLISNDEKKEELLLTNIINFKVSKIISNVQLKYPINSEIIDLTSANSLKMDWEKLPDAVSYTIEILQKDKAGDKVILKTESNINHFILDDLTLLDEGKFKWKVSANIKTTGKIFTTPVSESFFIISLNSGPKDVPVILSKSKQHIDKK